MSRGGHSRQRRRFDPANYADTVLDLDFSRLDLMSLTGSSINSIACAARGTSCTPITASKPTYDATGLNGEQPAAIMNGFGLACPIGALLSGKSGVTLFIVARDTTTAQNTAYVFEYGSNGAANVGELASLPNFLSVDANVSMFAPGSAGVNQWRANANTCDLVTTRTLTYRVDYARSTNEIDAIRANETDLAGAYTTNTNSSGTTLANRTLYVGARNGGGNGWLGVVARIVVVDEAVTDTVRGQFEAYFAARYGNPSPATMAARRTPVLVWAGQSNAQDQHGTGATSVTTRWAGPHSNPSVRAYRRSIISASDVTETWQSMRARQYGVVATEGWPGADMSCVMELVRRGGRAPRFIEYSHGATTLAVDWLAPSGTDCVNLISTINAAIAAETTASPEYVFVWQQGESDAITSGHANAYAANIIALFARIASQIPALATMKIVVCALHSNCALGDSTTRATIRAAQAAFVALDPTNRRLVETSDLTHYDGVPGTHYDEASKIVLGRRIGRAVLELTP